MVARPASAAPLRASSTSDSWTSKRPSSASHVLHCLASNRHSKTVNVTGPQEPRPESFRNNTAYRSSTTSAKGKAVPQFQNGVSGYLSHSLRELVAAPRDPDDPPRRQPDRVRAWTSSTRRSRSRRSRGCAAARRSSPSTRGRCEGAISAAPRSSASLARSSGSGRAAKT